MRIIGFQFSKVNAEKKGPVEKGTGANIEINFDNFEKAKIELLKEEDTVVLDFQFKITYETKDKKKESGHVEMKGKISLATSKDETKEFEKSWKKKAVPSSVMAFIYNFILKKCSIKALQIEEDLNLPFHVTIPHLTQKKKEE